MRRPGIFTAIASTAFISACTSLPGLDGGWGRPPSALTGTTWWLSELRPAGVNATLRPDNPARYELQFLRDGTLAVVLDCNRGTARWQSSGRGGLTLSPLGITRMACPRGSIDTQVAQELERVRSYMVQGNSLTLGPSPGRGSMLWTRPQIQPR